MKNAFGAIVWALLAMQCSVERPGVADSTFNSPKFFHAATNTESCANCHEKDRPTPKAGVKHGGGKDCIACHKTSDSRAGFLPVQVFAHPAPLKTCLPCHTVDRPQPPHPASGDCLQCHSYPKWK